ncbi:hypothetical protein TREAZ_1986 [Leadbettera azotonutricia ZAS-9]|uniref:Uncharacterized protein n=2 Tax=Leadbettera azotonutricia TaxID=150829 RepID=F5YAM0_LEAAZ|nr:hypothetical protein TREAZ_1986 [Leadbettera azotonutricia ZAS-9]
MQEIWIPEFFIALFLFLPLIRSKVKKLEPQTGIVWLPLTAFILSIGLFFAYGFRPEAIPLLLLAGIMTIFHIPVMIAFRSSAGFDDFPRKHRIFTPLGLIILALALFPAFWFSPYDDAEDNTEGVYSFILKEGSKAFNARLYSDGESGFRTARPLLVLAPPVFGARALDAVAKASRDRGFAVLTYIPRGLDSPAEWLGHFRAFTAGMKRASANAKGRAFEERRKGEILSILGLVKQNPSIGEGLRLSDRASAGQIFIGGYDASGSALVLLGGNPEFTRNNPEVKGLLAMESPLWSLFREEERVFNPLPPDSGWFLSVKTGIGHWFAGLKPKKIAGLGETPRVNFPMLFMMSDKALTAQGKDGQYAAVYSALRSCREPSALAVADGAGPLDYAGFPSRYPVLSLLYRGRGKEVWRDADFANGTAQIIANFAALVLDADGIANPLRKIALPKDVHIEPHSWTLPNLGL